MTTLNNADTLDLEDKIDCVIIDPATEVIIGGFADASDVQVDIACKTAAAAFPDFSTTTVSERIDLLSRLSSLYEKHREEMAHLISTEIGVPIDLARGAQTRSGARHLKSAIKTVKSFEWQRSIRNRETTILFEPIGVCGLITPWNWPMNQMIAKIAYALAAGCTIVLKPSDIAPSCANLLTHLIEQAGFNEGVFNLVQGRGTTAGNALCRHPVPRMISFTGSTDAGMSVSKAAADTLKRVTLELGGKSANIVFADIDLDKVISRAVRSCFHNSGQSCNAPTRLLVDRAVYSNAVKRAKKAGEKVSVGLPGKSGNHLGPVASRHQFQHVQSMIKAGIEEGAKLLVGGPGKPVGFDTGYFVKPTIFHDVDNQMQIAQQEIFGPVLCMMPFDDEDHAIEIANDVPYGLAAYIHSRDTKRAKRVARQLDVGMIQINGAAHSSLAPFGGYKQSGNGREYGEHGLMEFLEVKAISS